jgi:hypothetical protein
VTASLACHSTPAPPNVCVLRERNNTKTKATTTPTTTTENIIDSIITAIGYHLLNNSNYTTDNGTTCGVPNNLFDIRHLNQKIDRYKYTVCQLLLRSLCYWLLSKQ